MTESEILQIIDKQIKKQMNIILSGQSENPTIDSSGNASEDIQNLFSGMQGITQRPVMHPFGLVSKAPDGTTQVVARQGDHTGNRIILGHRDGGRPNDFNQGEVVLYNEFGQAIYIREGKIQVGSTNSANPMVLGDILVNFLTALMNDFLNAPQIGQCAVGPVFLDPTIRTQMVAQIQQYLTTSSTNIVSQVTFTERGGS